MRYFIEFSYKGTAYHGWQIQPNALTVQQVIEHVFLKLFQQEVKLSGAGRTDTGVHARHMAAHFDSDINFEDQILYQLNCLLPKDIAIHDLYLVKDDAHTRFDALSRTYNYHISTVKDVFSFNEAYQFHYPLDLDAMNQACDVLCDYKDFQCFSKSNTDVKTYHCKIMEANWNPLGHQLIFTITADRFLRNMVRAIVGTMIEIGQGKMTIDQLHQVIKSKDRGQAGYSVPAHGLYLHKIEYPTTIKKDIING